MEYDEDLAVEFMQQNAETSRKYTDDDMLNIIDVIWDYYESNGMLDISFDDKGDDELDVDKLIVYVTKMLRRDKHSEVLADDIRPLVLAELQYEENLGQS